MDVTWKAEGACRWVEPELFYPTSESDADAQPAKQVCSSCPVRQPCLDYALATREFEGIWGGLTGAERRALDQRRHALTA